MDLSGEISESEPMINVQLSLEFIYITANLSFLPILKTRVLNIITRERWPCRDCCGLMGFGLIFSLKVTLHKRN
jgi:hypothetical protein